MAKTKIYGGRWKLQDGALGSGGQSEVFRAIDTSGELEGEFALKRVKNPKRHQRFCAEIEAIKRLQHYNIIRLIDHSALDVEDAADEKQYLVMPIAAGRDLERPERVAPYKDSIDSVLQVALPLAAVLGFAHSAHIIHRDVKPANILFTGNDHEFWLTDFGICLIRDQERTTPVDEVVGPVAFMAPELEAGGQLDVTPAADVYSLGKVIYFMVSGGVVLPRERLGEPEFAKVFSGGGRHHLLRLLLGDMICPLSTRIKSMDEVTRRLLEIQDWDRKAVLAPVSLASLSAIQKLQERAHTSRQVLEENQAIDATETQRFEAVQTSVLDWLGAELEKTAALLGTTELRAERRPVTLSKNHSVLIRIGHNSVYRTSGGMELILEITPEQAGVSHALKFLLCNRNDFVVTVQTQIGPGPMRAPAPQVKEAVDRRLALIACYVKSTLPQVPSRTMGYLTRKQFIGRPGTKVTPQARGLQVKQTRHIEAITLSFHGDATLHTEFKASEWPHAADALKSMVEEAINTFIDVVQRPYFFPSP